MYGEKLDKRCTACEKDVSIRVDIMYMVGDKMYTKEFDCTHCGADLAVEEKAIIKEAKLKGESVVAVFC